MAGVVFCLFEQEAEAGFGAGFNKPLRPNGNVDALGAGPSAGRLLFSPNDWPTVKSSAGGELGDKANASVGPVDSMKVTSL